MTFHNGAGWVGTVALAPDGRRVASAHSGSVLIWDPRTGEELHRLTGPQSTRGHIALAFSPDGTILAASGPGKALNLWDTATWAPLRALEGSAAPVVDADFSRDGRLLAAACADGTVRLWDIAKGTAVWTIQGHGEAASAVTFAPDGRRLASGGYDHQARVWDITTGAELASYSGHVNFVYDVAFAPDGRTVASVGGYYRGPDAAEVRLWDSLTGQEIAKLVGHTGLVTAVVYFPGGRRLATASDDRTIKIWDSRTLEDVFTLRGHTSGVLSLAASRDGRQLVSGSIDHTAKTWSAATPDRATAAELSLRRTAVERVQSLVSRYLLKSDVIEALKTEKSLSPHLRATALEIANHRAESAAGLYQAGWLTAVRPGGRPEDYRLAVRRLEAACQAVSDDSEKNAQYRRALAMALFRAGESAKAIEIIDDLGKREPAKIAPLPGPSPKPLDLAVTALASHQLGAPHAHGPLSNNFVSSRSPRPGPTIRRPRCCSTRPRV